MKQISAVQMSVASPEISGWPWVEDDQQLPSVMPDGQAWPRISIVTPSLDQGEFIEETIRSVLLQGYPNLEYIVIDGGSTDGSVDILKKYDEHIDYWVSEPDRGQAHAINKGFSRASGDWVAWLNSDDLLLPGALRAVAEATAGDKMIDWIVGSVVVTDAVRKRLRVFEPICDTDDWLDFLCTKRATGTSLPQPSSFWSRKALAQAGMLDETLNYVMDFEYWVRLARCGYRPLLLVRELAIFRLSGESKSGTGMTKFIREEKLVVNKYRMECPPLLRFRLLIYRTFIEQLRWYRMMVNRGRGRFFDLARRVKLYFCRS